jgi:hypothetical protein
MVSPLSLGQLNDLIFNNHPYSSKMLEAQATDKVTDYKMEELKVISDALIENIYYRTLVDEKDYKVKVEPIGEEFSTTMPNTSDEIKIYQKQIPFIMNNVRVKVEQVLHKPIKISDLLKEISNNHSKLFHFTY